jgi:hypothetical protein
VPVRLDSIFATATKGKIGKAAIARMLQNDTASIALNYLPLASGVDTIALRVTFHGFEWKIPEQIALTTYAIVSSEPAQLGALQDLDFGSVRTDSTKTLSLSVTNSGCNALRIDSIVSTNPALFSLGELAMPMYVKADSTLHLPVQFTPQSSGLAIESIEIGTNAGHEFVTVQGNGVKVLAGVDDVLSNRILLYPNPVSSTLLATELTRITIYDDLGREVLRGVGDEFDVSMLAGGQYFVRAGGRIAPLIISRP